MSAVKNLRAMFEKQQQLQQEAATSPGPERGRSPGASSTSSVTPRPLSKVRTSFIAVEKDGRIGLAKRDQSGDSGASIKELSGETAGETASVSQGNDPDPHEHREQEGTENRSSVRNTARGRAGSGISGSGAPENAGTGSDTSGGVFSSVATDQTVSSRTSATSGSVGRETSTTIVKETSAESRQAIRQTKTGSGSDDTAPAPAPAPASVGGRSQPDDKASETQAKTQGSSREDQTSGSESRAEIKQSSGDTSAGRSGPGARGGSGETLKGTETGKLKAGKIAASHPKATSIPANSKTPTKPSAKSLSSKLPDKTAPAPAQPASRSSTPTTAKATTGKKPASLNVSPTGFVKPKVKSPTRPVKLPSSLTTHTAASGSKVSGSRQTLSRASGNIQTGPNSHARPASRTSGATSVPNKPLRRQASVVNRPRPSIGPPPKQQARDYPITKKEGRVDESFLARMMRPTAASSSKTTEKVPITPPRRPGAVSRKPGSGRLSSKASSIGSPEAMRKISPSASKNFANAVAQTAIAEEAISVAKEADGGMPLSISTEKIVARHPAKIPDPVLQVQEPTPVIEKSTESAFDMEAVKDIATPPASESESEAVQEEHEDTTEQVPAEPKEVGIIEESW